MKFKTFLIALLLFTALGVNAQNQKSAEKEAKAQTEKMETKLDLDHHQKQLIQRHNSVFYSNFERYSALKNPTDAQTETMEGYAQKYKEGIKEILSDEQYTTFTEMMEKSKNSFLK